MGHTVELSERAYKALLEMALRQEQTPESIANHLIEAAARGRIVYSDVDDFFRSLGVAEEELQASDAIFQEHERARLAGQEE